MAFNIGGILAHFDFRIYVVLNALILYFHKTLWGVTVTVNVLNESRVELY